MTWGFDFYDFWTIFEKTGQKKPLARSVQTLFEQIWLEDSDLHESTLGQETSFTSLQFEKFKKMGRVVRENAHILFNHAEDIRINNVNALEVEISMFINDKTEITWPTVYPIGSLLNKSRGLKSVKV